MILQKTQRKFCEIAHKQMKQKIAVLEQQLKESTERLTKMQETQISNPTPQNQLHKEITSQKKCFQKINSKGAVADLQQTSAHHQMNNQTIAIKDKNIKLQQELRKMEHQYDDVVAQNDQLKWDNQELRNTLEKVQSGLHLFKTDLRFQEKIPADLSANNDRAYKYKSERGFAMTQVENLQKQLQLLQQNLTTQREIYNTDQSEAYRRIQALEAECTYLKNGSARLNTARPTHHRQFSEGNQTLFDTPVNVRTLSQNYQFNDGAAMLTPYMHSRQLSESTESSSDNESYRSSTNMCEYHNDHGYQHTDTRSLLQDHHSQRNSHVFCSWQQDNMLENSLSLSQPTTDGYYNSRPIIKDPRYLSQEYDRFYENAAYSPWLQYSIPSCRSLPKELDKSTNRLSVHRSSSLGSRVTSQQTTRHYKKVVTSHGESYVICDTIHMMSELRKGERVIVHRYYHDDGTVRALNVTINNKPWHVGVELDLPGLYANVPHNNLYLHHIFAGGNPDSDGAVNGVRYFKW